MALRAARSSHQVGRLIARAIPRLDGWWPSRESDGQDPAYRATLLLILHCYYSRMSFPVVNGMRAIEFGTPGAFREELNALVLAGKKKATAGTLEWDYQAEGESIETVGEKLAVLNSAGAHVATIEATRVEVVNYSEVPDEFALAEGEGDLSGDDFREGHFRYWSRQGLSIQADTQIVLLYFDLVEVILENKVAL